MLALTTHETIPPPSFSAFKPDNNPQISNQMEIFL